MSTPITHVEQNPQQHRVATSVMTDETQHEVRCGTCFREIYVNDEDYQNYSEALISGTDNPFCCEMCGEEYEEVVYLI